jgi:hypothetical protein
MDDLLEQAAKDAFRSVRSADEIPAAFARVEALLVGQCRLTQ